MYVDRKDKFVSEYIRELGTWDTLNVQVLA